MNYDQARQRFERDVRPRAGNVLLERNTYLERATVDVPQGIRPYEGDFPTKAVTYAVRFHATDVVTWWPNGTVIFRHGGFETMSTADRMRWAGGYYVWKERENLFVKAGDEPVWRSGANGAVRVAFGGIIFWCDEYKAGASATYADTQRDWQDQANERARARRVERRDSCLDMIVGNPRGKWGWHHVDGPGMRVTNGVLWGGNHPVAVAYPQPEQGVDANLLVVSRRAIKRTKLAGELIERAMVRGCKLTFEDHGVVVAETQNRRHA